MLNNILYFQVFHASDKKSGIRDLTIVPFKGKRKMYVYLKAFIYTGISYNQLTLKCSLHEVLRFFILINKRVFEDDDKMFKTCIIAIMHAMMIKVPFIY